MRVGILVLLALVSFAGCLSSDEDNREGDGDSPVYPYYDATDGLYHYRVEVDGGHMYVAWAPGAVSTAWTDGGEGAIEFDGGSHVLVLQDSTWLPAEGKHSVTSGSTFTFLPSPGTTSILAFDGFAYDFLDPRIDGIGAGAWNQIVSGENMWDLSAHQEANFPHRTPGQPNYNLAIDYFAQYFRDLGMEVEVDPYGTQDVTDLTGCIPGLGPTCPESFANIVATKPGRDLTKVIFVAGGHYDMVPGTTHAAFDDTSGVVGTMELARALAPYEFDHTLMFGLWGGEENGILGSQFWVQSHPEMKARIVSYWNLDVIGMSWPAPITAPSPLVISAGPDVPTGSSGETQDPVSGSLLDWAETLQTRWLGFPSEVNGTKMFYYEGHASGQANGYTGVNVQSDHTPFAAAGIPSYFIFNGDALSNPVGIHNERDTLTNMTMVSFYGFDAPLDASWPDPLTWEPAKQALARSFEANIWFPFYHTVLTDLGVYTPPGVAASVPTS